MTRVHTGEVRPFMHTTVCLGAFLRACVSLDSGCPGSGGVIERVFTTAGKQYDDLKKNTMDKTLENTLSRCGVYGHKYMQVS
jgi:hypothetical protein